MHYFNFRYLVIKIINNENLTEKELTQIFNLLKHPLRRAILKYLSDGPRAYSQILKIFNIQESSVLNYHLREMGDLLIIKDVNGKYELNEAGRICLQLVIKVKEKEDIHRFNKIEMWAAGIKKTLIFIQMLFSVLIIILVLELFLLNFIDLSSILWMFIPNAVWDFLLTKAVFTVYEKSGRNEINKIEKKEKLGMFSFLFSISILLQIILRLLW